MQSIGQVEALVCEVVNAFLRKTVGRGASTLSATLRSDALFIHLRDVLTPKEQALATGLPEEARLGQGMVRDARDHLVRRGRDDLAAELAAIVGRRPVAVLHDVDPASGDEVIAFTFGRGDPGRPACDAARGAARRRGAAG